MKGEGQKIYEKPKGHAKNKKYCNKNEKTFLMGS